MKALTAFATLFGAKIVFNPEFIVERTQRYYFLYPSLKKLVKEEFYYAGLYLGKTKNGIFFPSFNLLNSLVPAAANKVVLDRKAAWLFICGRDAFRGGVVKLMGSRRKGDAVLVINEFGECLGFGRLMAGLDVPLNEVVVKNVLDVGDFLRRE
jgi:ribosome biogenesis protein Nip4